MNLKQLFSSKKLGITALIVLFILIFFLILAVFLLRYEESQKGNLVSVNNSEQKQLEERSGLFERFPNSSNIGNSIIDGEYIWVANGQGLIRFNKSTGEQKIFTETDGLLGNETTGIIKYGEEIWITSQSRGISIFNTKTNSWRYFSTANGLISDANLMMKLDSDTLWLATFDGFAKYDFTTQKWTSWKEGAGLRFASVQNFVFNDDYVWIYVSPNAYTRGGVVRLDKKMLTWTDVHANNQIFTERQLGWESLSLDGEYLHAIAGKKIYRQHIPSGIWDSLETNTANLNQSHIGAKKINNQYWSFNEDGNIEILENDKHQVIDIDPLNHYCSTVFHNFNFSGLEEGYSKNFSFDGNSLWFGCRQGFVSYNIGSKTWDFKSTKSDYPAEIYNILAVNRGVLLVDSNLGLGLVEPYNQKWTFIRSLETGNSLWESALWVGDEIYFVEVLETFGMGSPTKPPRLWHYDTKNKTVTQVVVPEDIFLGTLINSKINNSLWFNAGSQLQEFDLDTKKILSYEPEIEDGIYFVISDVKEKDKKLWFSSNSGLGYFDVISKNFETINTPFDIKFSDQRVDRPVFIGNQIWDYVTDYPQSQTHVYDLASQAWKQLSQPTPSLQFDEIRDIIGTSKYLFVLRSGRVPHSPRVRGDVFSPTFFYTRHGLNVYDITKDSWEFFTSEDGMLDGEVQNMYLDGDDVWFVNGNNGIWKMNIKQLDKN